LSAFAWAGSAIYSENAYVQLQMRIATATDKNLDAIAIDFFGINGLPRNSGENDTSYRSRILNAIMRPATTRNAMNEALTYLIGTSPIIFEPERPADSGGYTVGGGGYCVAGGWAHYLPYQCFITVPGSIISSIANIAGWGIPTGAWNTPSYEVWEGSEEFNIATDATVIYQAINSTKPEGTTCWVRFV
jgi:hypothetical protein